MVLTLASFKIFLKKFLITFICVIALLFWINSSGMYIYWRSPICKIEIKNASEKYMSYVNSGCAKGLGNHMFQLASMFALGKVFNRTFFSLSNSICNQTLIPEVNRIFARFPKYITIQETPPEETFRSEYSLDCCKYHNPEDFHDVKEKYLVLDANYFQSYKYFNPIKREIRLLFEFNEQIKVAVKNKKRYLFKNDEKSHKFCVHIRRGDFIENIQLESRTEFIEPAIKFIHKNLSQKRKKNISLILIGQDPDFINTLNYNKNNFSSIHSIQMASREEDMYFGIKVCDTLLITASGSTFAWWIGYLMPEGSQVFYNSQVSKTRNFSKDFYDFDYFPHEWNMLELNKAERKVYLDNRWYYERFGWPKNLIGRI